MYSRFVYSKQKALYQAVIIFTPKKAPKTTPKLYHKIVDAMTLRTGNYWNRMPEKQICELRSSQNNTGSSLDIFLGIRDDL